jgi:tetratricopeptide (TPR) repeat protein
LGGSNNNDPWTWVDVAAPLTFADYAAGRDPALETALGYAPGPPLADQLLEAAKAGGVPRVRQTLAIYRSNSAHRYQNLELLVRRAAESLSASKFPQEGYAVAQVGAEAFPRSPNSFVALAFLAERAGKMEAAREAAQRALALDPDSRQARSVLERTASR